MAVLALSNVPDSVISAVIAAVVAFGVAVFGQVAIATRERTGRRYERRRAALIDVQDAALELRRQLRQYGELIRANPGRQAASVSAVEQEFDAARSRLAVALSRVEDKRAVAAVSNWRSAASVSFISELELSASREQASWDEMNAQIGRALQTKSGAGG